MPIPISRNTSWADYQGLRMVVLIGLYGAMFGILAHWRGSVRLGMIAHAEHDSLNGILASVKKH